MIKFCKKCLFPNTKPDLVFDGNGICDACISADQKWARADAIDWDAREKEFNQIVDSIDKSGLYDCVVPVSGGKDSTWQAYRLKHVHKLRPLAVTFDQFDQTPTGIHNLNVIRDLGIDHIHFTLNPHVVRDLVYKGFREVGDPYWVNHVGIFSIPHRIAANFNIPLVVFGENPQFEYGGPEANRKPQPMNKRWRQEFGGLRGLREEDMVDENISERDLAILEFPEGEQAERVKGLFYGDYFRWDPAFHTDFIRQFGWQSLGEPQKGSYSTVENIDMQFIDIREHIKYLKFGYGRATDQVNIDIRAGKITRDMALKIIDDCDGKVSEENISAFCQYLGIERSEYEEIVDDFVNIDLFKKTNSGWTPIFERLNNE